MSEPRQINWEEHAHRASRSLQHLQARYMELESELDCVYELIDWIKEANIPEANEIIQRHAQKVVSEVEEELAR